jgi:hypothetical protein
MKRLEFRENIKEKAIIALGSAIRSRNATLKYPKGHEKVEIKKHQM